MAKIIDISDKYDDEVLTLKVKEGMEYEINENKDDVMKAMYIVKDSGEEMSLEQMDEIIGIILGEKAVQDFKKIKFRNYLNVIKSVLSVIANVNPEDYDKRFQK